LEEEITVRGVVRRGRRYWFASLSLTTAAGRRFHPAGARLYEVRKFQASASRRKILKPGTRFRKILKPGTGLGVDAKDPDGV